MRTVNKFIFTGLFFVLAVCAFAQAQDSIVHADTTVITAQDVTVVPPDSLKAADSLQVMTDTVPPKKTKVYLRLFGRDSIRHNLQTIGCLQAVRRDDCHILCGNNSSICMHNTILGLCKGTDRQHKKQTCENKFIYSPHSLIQPGYWKSQLRQPSLIRTYVLFCFLMIQSCSSSSRFRDSTIDFKA